MKSSFLIMAALSALSLTEASAQTHYATGFDTPTQKQGWQMFRKGATDINNEWTFGTVLPYTAPACLYHNYPVGGATPTDDWFVSPVFQFATGGKIDSVRTHFSGFGVPATADTLAIYLLVGSPDPALATQRKLLYDYRDAHYANDNTWRKTDPIAIPNTPGSAYIAIRYRTVSNWLDVRFDNLAITSNTATGLSDVRKNDQGFVCYPNPAHNSIEIRSAQTIAQIAIFDLTGKEMMRQPFQKSINIAQLTPGTYMVKAILANGNTSTQLLTKQ